MVESGLESSRRDFVFEPTMVKENSSNRVVNFEFAAERYRRGGGLVAYGIKSPVVFIDKSLMAKVLITNCLWIVDNLCLLSIKSLIQCI